MLKTVHAKRGMVTSPHRLASQAGLAVLREGGNAIDAVAASAAMLTVVYPHMTGIGGDGFWMIAEEGGDPVCIASAGRAGEKVNAALYKSKGYSAIPSRGPLAANTMAGTVKGWEEALKISRDWGSPLSLARLLSPAADMAERGISVTQSQAELTEEKAEELRDAAGFAESFMPGGAAPRQGSILTLPALARTLRHLGEAGLDSFYRGPLAVSLIADLAEAGSPLTAMDFSSHQAVLTRPLRLKLPGMELFNLPPPTQGLASLIILGLFARQKIAEADGFDHIHALVEATKLAFLIRDSIVGDPADLAVDPQDFLDPNRLDQLAGEIDPSRARPWPSPPSSGDTVWLGAVDEAGRMVSYIQSLYFEFGSGLVLPGSGILWQNRGSSFELEGSGRRLLRPGRLPFHTLNPAFARFDDGRSMVYGTMGGDGQPQTQAAMFSRYAFFGQDLQMSISAPRWLLGRTWGTNSTSLKLESRFDPAIGAALAGAGHKVEIVSPLTSLMGHAGAIVRQADGMIEGASDPRSDGIAAGW